MYLIDPPVKQLFLQRLVVRSFCYLKQDVLPLFPLDCVLALPPCGCHSVGCPYNDHLGPAPHENHHCHGYPDSDLREHLLHRRCFVLRASCQRKSRFSEFTTSRWLMFRSPALLREASSWGFSGSSSRALMCCSVSNAAPSLSSVWVLKELALALLSAARITPLYVSTSHRSASVD